MSQTEVIVIVCVIAGVLVIGCVGLSLVGLLLPALGKARSQARLLKDATQIKQIHQSWVVWSRDWDGRFPTPGLINRLAVGGEEVPGRGQEDVLANDHAALYSACIMANFISPELCVGPTEPNPDVLVKDDYDWELYDPENDSYWDPSFQLRLNSICNASYAVLPLAGDRKELEWRETFNSKYAVIANRGVRDGTLLEPDFGRSFTLQIHGSRKEWVGNVCFNDNHVQVCNTFLPQGIAYVDDAGIEYPDNLFRNDTGGDSNAAGHDIWLTLIDSISGTPENLSLSAQWD
ncbi:MAG: hypothetical protein JSV91_06235 [Phycisphaerales bacterium]|nr:MAG: hypothetical protein JSV91_06235 [Phycisphaerales bacterium]